jgi:hypothetical protein
MIQLRPLVEDLLGQILLPHGMAQRREACARGTYAPNTRKTDMEDRGHGAYARGTYIQHTISPSASDPFPPSRLCLKHRPLRDSSIRAATAAALVRLTTAAPHAILCHGTFSQKPSTRAQTQTPDT